jgi:hypothetical protein
MTEGLAKRFGWWWRDPAKALRRPFPDTSAKEIRKIVWPDLQRAAFNYELASRHDGRRKYLLGERFDRLTPTQMVKLALCWPRNLRPLQPIRFLPYAESQSPDVTQILRGIASEGSLPLTASAARDFRVLKQRVLDREMIEKDHARYTGWTAPRYFAINLKECGNTAIEKAFRKHVDAERKRLNIPNPPKNKGRANKSARGISFRKIEALDAPSDYDAGQARLARREAMRLFRQWRRSLTDEK